MLAGGHTVQDKEPKFGLVAVGLASPDRLMTKGGVCPGDVLVLTKPLGTGVTTTALKPPALQTSADIEQAISWMSRLNAESSALALSHGVRGATDITGYGLLGHGMEMAEASGVRLVLHARAIPSVRGASLRARRVHPRRERRQPDSSLRPAGALRSFYRQVFTKPALRRPDVGRPAHYCPPPRNLPSWMPPPKARFRFGWSGALSRGRASRSGIQAPLRRRAASKVTRSYRGLTQAGHHRVG